MTQTRHNDVNPAEQSDKYQMALQDSTGRWIGLVVNNMLTDVRSFPITQEPPQQKLEQMSFHLGRGVEKWLPNSFSFYDNRDSWRLTPGKLHASPMWRWARGMRNHNTHAPGSVNFKPLIGGNTLAASFVASAEYSGASTYTVIHVWLLIRKRVQPLAVVNPGTLTMELRDNSGAVLKTTTHTAADISDVVSQWVDFTLSSSQTLTSGNTYWVVLHGATADSMDNCWEVGCGLDAAGKTAPSSGTAWGSWTSTTYSQYFRVTNVDTARVIWPFKFDSGFYAVFSDDAGGASLLFVNGVRGQATGTQTSTTLQDTGHGTYGATAWPTGRFQGAYVRIIRGTGAGQVRAIKGSTGDTLTVDPWTITPVTADSEYVVYGTDWWFEIVGAFSSQVLAPPAYANGIMYFPMGDSVDIVRMHLDYSDTDDHVFASEATNHNRASFLIPGFVAIDGPVIWRGNNIATASGAPNGSKVSVARANVNGLAWGTDLTFKTSILIGDNTQTITNLWFHTNKLYVFKEDQIFAVENDVPVQIKAGTEAYPSRRNGVGVTTGMDSQLYVGLRHSLFMIAGSLIVDVGMQRDASIPSSRAGYIADIESVNAWNFLALDAGDSGTSSILIYDINTQTFGEDIRAYASGRRIRSVTWQPCENTNPRLWFECGGELMYQAFPTYDVRPLNDATIQYMWECNVETSTMDLLSVDPKYFSTLSAVTKHLAEINAANGGHEIWVDYQMDNDVGTSNWKSAGAFTVSPSDILSLAEGSRRMIRFRFRLITSDVLTPVILERFGLTLVSRTPIYHGWSIMAVLDSDDEEQKVLGTIKWLNEKASLAELLTLTSNNPLYHGKKVILQQEPVKNIDEFDPDAQDVSGVINIQLAEVA